MDNKRLRVGIFFGGSSREREVSFAGGRTVYDNLDKDLFDAVPIFVDEFGNMVLLNWEFIYRGTIRDFYPPVNYLPATKHGFQIYSESISLSHNERLEMLGEIGKVLSANELSSLIDFGFLALHGERGEDGNIQGLLEWYGIPYSGSGILASAVGMNKAIQKSWMENFGFDGPKYLCITKEKWYQDKDAFYHQVTESVGFPAVIKSVNQGSSIGVTILNDDDKHRFVQAVNNSFFSIELTRQEWQSSDKVGYVRELSDIRSSLGFPLLINGNEVAHPETALIQLDDLLEGNKMVTLTAIRGEVEVIAEQFIAGREFSCIVVRNENEEIVALPPTEIAKSTQFFDYKSKYLPGLSRKITPIDLPDAEIERIREKCSTLFENLGFNVYARIDGFYTEEGRILLNDPNTTSGMMPSSFFFHQAAEIGLNPSEFLTYIIRSSYAERIKTVPSFIRQKKSLDLLDQRISETTTSENQKKRVAVIMGGYSTERHISMESGRNIYEKLASSSTYQPIPIFLTGSNEKQYLYQIPIHIMLKDNADDIKQKVEDYHAISILTSIRNQATSITRKYAHLNPVFEPKSVTYEGLKDICDSVFIALHGRPGEDGEIQKHLNKIGLPYNGSGVESSSTTIDKFKTNNILRENGFLVADGALITKADWMTDKAKVMHQIGLMQLPLIAKPADEGCSSAVKKLKTLEAFEAYAEATFRETDVIDEALRKTLDVQDKEEFPAKDYFLVEQFIDRNGADHFLEITGGLVTKYVDGKLVYEVFEPSEALAEGEILSLAEKFLAGEGQNITPARFAGNPEDNGIISKQVRAVLQSVAECLQVEGYCRIDAFVRIFGDNQVEVIIIEINSLPGMTPATCIYHQAAINGYKPFDFIDQILTFGEQRLQQQSN